MEALKWDRGQLRQGSEYKIIAVRLNKEKDRDILEILDNINASGYIKALIRKDIQEGTIEND